MNSKFSAKIKHLQNNAGLIFAGQRDLKGLLLDAKRGTLHFCAHTSSSMNPTLCESDILEIAAYSDQPIHRGDVIFFLPSDRDRPVVHRVIQVTAEGIRTKGDSNNHVDLWFIRPEDVIGRVVWATRGKKRRLIYGGTVGLIWSFGMRGLKRVEKCFSFFYHLLAQSGLLRRLVPLHKRIKIIAIKRPGGRAFKLLLENWVIGNYQPGMPYWQIQRPFRLFIDVESLPK